MHIFFSYFNSQRNLYLSEFEWLAAVQARPHSCAMHPYTLSHLLKSNRHEVGSEPK